MTRLNARAGHDSWADPVCSKTGCCADSTKLACPWFRGISPTLCVLELVAEKKLCFLIIIIGREVDRHGKKGAYGLPVRSAAALVSYI